MRKGRIYSEVRKKIILRITIVLFSLLMIATFVAIVLISCKKEEVNILSAEGAIVWRVVYVNPEVKSPDYVYNILESDVKYGQIPYEFGTAFIELPKIYTDSSSAITRFYQLYSESNLVWQAYPYCLIEDWDKFEEDDEGKSKGYLLSERSSLIDTWLICHKFGLIDSAGHYID